MNGLNMLDSSKDPIAATYQLIIIFCVDWSRQRTFGSKFIINHDKFVTLFTR